MFDFDINNPNEFIPGQSPAPNEQGQGGLSGLAEAAQSVPGVPAIPQQLLGGLQGNNKQDDLENMLFPRIRDMDQLNQARSARRGQLGSLQQALNMPQDEMSGIDHILLGMMTNERPESVGHGYRRGVASALASKNTRTKQKREAAILSAQAGLNFEKSEGDNDDQLESVAISNLRQLAKPILPRVGSLGGAGRGRSGGGSRFRWVPGTGYVDTEVLDETGTPKVVFGDPKVAISVRQAARKSAEKEVESNLHKMTFKTSKEKEAYLESRTDEIASDMLGGTTPPTPSAAAPVRPSGGLAGAMQAKAAPAATAPVKRANVPDWRNAAGEEGRMEIYQTEAADIQQKLANEKDPARKRSLQADLTAVQNEMKALGGDLPNYALETPEERAGKTKLNEKLAESQVEYATKLRNDSETSLKMISAVNEIRQLKFDPGAFAKWKQRGGNILEALGSDGPLARAAAQSGNAEAILQGLSNARISLEKGVQTRDDEARFKAEIAKITDPRQGYEYMLKYMEELARKNIDQYNTVETYRKQKGSYDGAEQAWQERNQKFGGLVKRYQGSFIGRTEFINAIVNDPKNKAAYKGDESKLRERAEREWAILGGRK